MKTAQQQHQSVSVGGLIEPHENNSKGEDADSKETVRAEKGDRVRGAAPIASVGSSTSGEISSVNTLPQQPDIPGKDIAESHASLATVTAAECSSLQGDDPESNSNQQESRRQTLSTKQAQRTETGHRRSGATAANGDKLELLPQQQPRKRGSKKWRPKSQQQQQHRGHEKKQTESTPAATAAGFTPLSDGGSSPSDAIRTAGDRGQQAENDQDRAGPGRDLKRLDFHELSPSTSTDCEERSPLPKSNASRQADSIDSLCSSLLEILAEAGECTANERAAEDRGGVVQAAPAAPAPASKPSGATPADAKAQQQQQQQKRQDKQQAAKKWKEASAVVPPARQQPGGGDDKKSTSSTDKGVKLLLETVDVAGATAQWAVDNSRGGEFTQMLENVKQDSGAVSMDTRVVLGQGTGQGGRAHM